MQFLDILPEQPTWQIIDSSKLTTYMACPRKYFYNYVLGWQSDYPNNHLVFGSAWHLAQEALVKLNFTPEAIFLAQQRFMDYYREHFSEESDELFEPKTPNRALRAIEEYAAKHKEEFKHLEVLHVEIAGIVLVSDARTMTFKHDAILKSQRTGKTFGLDYKTSQRRESDWGDHWILATQMNLYLHALHCLYPEDEDLSMLVRCAFFRKTQPLLFENQLIEKTPEQFDTFVTRINAWLARLEEDTERLMQLESTEQDTMEAFPGNDTACFAYNRKCLYFDFCDSWSNPLTRCESTPIGFNVTWWNPLEQPEINEVVDLSKSEAQ